MSIQVHPIIGGKSIGEDIRRLEAGVHIVSGTPGRVFDMIRRRNLRTDGIKMLLIDEVSAAVGFAFASRCLFIPVAYFVHRPMSCSTSVSRTTFTIFTATCRQTRRSASFPPQ